MLYREFYSPLWHGIFRKRWPQKRTSSKCCSRVSKCLLYMPHPSRWPVVLQLSPWCSRHLRGRGANTFSVQVHTSTVSWETSLPIASDSKVLDLCYTAFDSCLSYSIFKYYFLSLMNSQILSQYGFSAGKDTLLQGLTTWVQSQAWRTLRLSCNTCMFILSHVHINTHTYIQRDLMQ